MTTAVAFVLGYLLGSIPFGVLITRALGLGDLRGIGSGNIGATNVLRTGNKAAAAATLVLDAGKGAVAVLLARALFGETAAMVAGFAAFLGHCFPVWLRFRGGKGVATFLGLTIALAWPAGLAACATWLATAFAFRYLVAGGAGRGGDGAALAGAARPARRDLVRDRGRGAGLRPPPCQYRPAARRDRAEDRRRTVAARSADRGDVKSGLRTCRPRQATSSLTGPAAGARGKRGGGTDRRDRAAPRQSS